MSPRVAFQFSKKTEEQNRRDVYSQRIWFKSSGMNVYIPQTLEEGQRFIENQAAIFARRIQSAERSWEKIEPHFFAITQHFHNAKLQKRYVCQPTHFGCEGQYRVPNTVIVRMHSARDVRLAHETIGHELLHLLFHGFFRAKRFGYAEREGMVDALVLTSPLRKLFPRYVRQSVGVVRQKTLDAILHRHATVVNS